jgi:thymidylate synthase (FAD)
MVIIKAGYEILTPLNRRDMLKQIEAAGRTCYKSEEKITEESAGSFVRMLIQRGHEAMIEHVGMSVRFICDRGISHEIVRHRLASYAQESTRYCNYRLNRFGRECTFVKPCFWEEGTEKYNIWQKACEAAEKEYFALLDAGATAQEARSVLPNSLKTEIVTTMNMRAWRHFFLLRTDGAAHPQMLEITRPLLAEMKALLPEIFDDIRSA